MPDSTRLRTYDGTLSRQAPDRRAKRIEIVVKAIGREGLEAPWSFFQFKVAAGVLDDLDAFDREHPVEPQRGDHAAFVRAEPGDRYRGACDTCEWEGPLRASSEGAESDCDSHLAVSYPFKAVEPQGREGR